MNQYEFEQARIERMGARVLDLPGVAMAARKALQKIDARDLREARAVLRGASKSEREEARRRAQALSEDSLELLAAALPPSDFRDAAQLLSGQEVCCENFRRVARHFGLPLLVTEQALQLLHRYNRCARAKGHAVSTHGWVGRRPRPDRWATKSCIGPSFRMPEWVP